MKNTIFLGLILFIFSACGDGKSNNAEQGQNFDQMAIDLCSCMRPLADMNVKMKKLVDQGKNQEVSALFPEVERISQEGEACAKSLEEKYGMVADTDEAKATAALKRHCADIAQMLERNQSMEQ